jgi:hypothetical protein
MGQAVKTAIRLDVVEVKTGVTQRGEGIVEQYRRATIRAAKRLFLL